MFQSMNVIQKEKECHANFLISATQYINTISSNVLKSHMNILCHEIIRMKNFQTTQWNNKKRYCQYCKSPWKNGDFSFKILPILRKSKRMKKIVKKVKNNKNLAKVESNIARGVHFGNKILIKCLICRNKVKFKLDPNNVKFISPAIKTQLFDMLFDKKNKKKNKKNSASSKEKSTPATATDASTACGNSEDTDEIKITYEYHPPTKIRKTEQTDVVPGKAAKKKKKKKKSKKRRNRKKKKNAPPEYSLPNALSKTMERTLVKRPFNNPFVPGFGNVGSCSSASDYIPFNKSGKRPSKKNKKKRASKKEVAPVTDIGKELVVNPFSDKVQGICNLSKKKKKLNKLKDLITKDEKKVTASHSLKDFISKL